MVCRSIGEARASLAELRRTVIEVAAEHDLAVMAASTHPFAHWQAQRHTAKERYDLLVTRERFFDQGIQYFLSLLHEKAFVRAAEQLEGYDVSKSGQMIFPYEPEATEVELKS